VSIRRPQDDSGMNQFTKQLSYQFSAFLLHAPTLPLPSAEKLKLLAERFSSQPVTGSNFALKFTGRRPEMGAFVNAPTSATHPPVTSQFAKWTSPSGHWELIVTAARVDVRFNALAHCEALEADSPVGPDVIWERLEKAFQDIGSVLSQPIHRVAFIVDAMEAASFVDASRAISKRFFRDDVVEDSDEVQDALVRLNLRRKWAIGTRQVTINRIETLSADVDGCRWQWDVNTDQADSTIKTSEEIHSFFGQAFAWVKQREATK